MKPFFKACMAFALALGVSACAAPQTASRAAMPDAGLPGMARPGMALASFTVSVPRSLSVNERNTYYPRGDIVWRGDPYGDRHAQVKAIFEESLRRAAPQIAGTRPVRMDIQVTRFHGLSEKARYSVGGVHDIDFRYRLIDTATGAQIGEMRHVKADLEALSGQAAMAADAQGRTQKARITAHLARVIAEELTVPGGHENARLGLLQAINEL
ncbi:DUF6778 family protein [Marivita sp. GX14005]|uniref:DUF6778 family protein n=1 Tax=Marivita sp. GX14005 TaxID=2942276 RepID=UPI0020192744|nr:DUF6778 family protein [Marivita sp. GX14005]MCL3882879.1 hypothetical protein [Marivita sp. GX14005]